MIRFMSTYTLTSAAPSAERLKSLAINGLPTQNGQRGLVNQSFGINLPPAGVLKAIGKSPILSSLLAPSLALEQVFDLADRQDIDPARPTQADMTLIRLVTHGRSGLPSRVFGASIGLQYSTQEAESLNVILTGTTYETPQGDLGSIAVSRALSTVNLGGRTEYFHRRAIRLLQDCGHDKPEGFQQAAHDFVETAEELYPNIVNPTDTRSA